MAINKSTTFSESNISIENNTSSLTISIYFHTDNPYTYFYNEPLYCTCNGVTQSQIVSYSVGGYVNTSFTFNNIAHNPDGSKTVSWSWNCDTGTQGLGNVGDSGNQPLTRINRTITNSVSGTDIDGNFSVNYIKMTDVDYTYKLRISLPFIEELEKIPYNTSDATFNLSQATISSLYSRYTTVNSFNLEFAVETWSSDGLTRISEGNEVIITARITGADPVFTDFDFGDINPTTVALTGDNTINVNGYSNIQITISNQDKAVAQKGATMVKYRIIVGTQTLDLNYSDSTISTTINNCMSGTYEIYAIDSRGNSTLVRKFASSVKDYTPLVRDTNYSVVRDSGGVGGNVTLTYSGSIWNDSFGSISNAFKTATYYIKKTDSSTWIDWSSLGITPTDITPTITNNTFSFSGLIRSDNPDTTWDLDSSYDIKIVLEDKLSNVEFEIVLASAIPNISLSRNGVGIMCDYDEILGGLLQIGGEIFKNIKLTSLYNNSSGTTSTVPLSDRSTNYDYIELYYKTNDNNTISSKKIYPISSSNIVCLDFSYDYSGTVYHKTANVQVNETNITFLSNKEFVNFGTNNSGNYIFITRVVGININ